MTELGDVYTNLAFWRQIQGDAARTVLCEPQHLAGLQAAVEAHGWADAVTVRASAGCPEGKFIVIDEAAIEAFHRQVLQRVASFGFRG